MPIASYDAWVDTDGNLCDRSGVRVASALTSAQVSATQALVSGGGKLTRKATGADATAPMRLGLSGVSVTDAASGTDLAKSYALRANFNAGLFRISGGTLVGSNANNAEIKGASILLTSNVGVTGALQLAPALDTIVSGTATQIRLRLYVGGGAYTPQYRAMVNGRYCSRVATAFSSVGAAHTLTIDLSSFGAEEKIVRFEWDGPAVAQYISIDAGYLWEPQDADRVMCGIFGASFEANGANRTPHLAYGARAAQRLGWEYHMMGVGGTGFVNNGSGNYAWSDATRIADLQQRAFDVIVIGGPTNDVGSSAAAIQAAATTTLAAMRTAAGARTPIFVLDTPNAQATSGAVTQAQAGAAVQAAVTALNDSRMWFVPASNDPAGAWITAGNSAEFIADGTHYNAAGEAYASDKLAAKFRALATANYL